jgi:formylmethanofuran dehydrogenase subunit E
MKYLRAREVATSSKKEHFPQCSICGDKQPSMYITIEDKLVCRGCKEKDLKAEFVDREQ